MVKRNTPVADEYILLARDSTSRYLIGPQGYGVSSRSEGIHQRTVFDLKEAGISAGREHYEATQRLPGQIRVTKSGRKIEAKVE